MGRGRGIQQTVLPRPICDHALILVEIGVVLRGPTPFRFENMRLNAVWFKETTNVWRPFSQEQESSSYKMFVKLKKIKILLKKWNRLIYKKVDWVT